MPVLLLFFFCVAILFTRILHTTLIEIFVIFPCSAEIADECNLNVEKILKFQVHDSLIKKICQNVFCSRFANKQIKYWEMNLTNKIMLIYLSVIVMHKIGIKMYNVRSSRLHTNYHRILYHSSHTIFFYQYQSN